MRVTDGCACNSPQFSASRPAHDTGAGSDHRPDSGAEQRAGSFLGTDLRSRVVCGGLGLWFVWEAVETFRQAQELCWGNFSSMAMLGLLPLLLWAGWKSEPAVLVRCAPILCWAAALAGLLGLLGLNGQFHWEKLMLPTEPLTPTLPCIRNTLPCRCSARQSRCGALSGFR